MTALSSVQDPTVPGPRGSLLLGLAKELRHDQLATLERAATEYGDVVRLVAGPPGRRISLYLVSHPDGVQRVLTGGDVYSKETPFYREIAAYFGDGVLTSHGQRWRRQRRTLAPLFTHRRTDHHVAAMATEAQRLVQRWRTAPGRSTRVDLHTELTEYTLRVIGRIMFGTDVDDAIPVIRDAFPELSEHIRRRVRSPLRLPRRWPVPAQRRAVAAQRSLHHVVDAIIERRRGAGGDEPDLITRLLAARDPHTDTPLSGTEIRDQVLTFLLAGHETTSTALTATLHLLGHHQDQQRRLHQELDTVLNGRTITAGDLGNLTHTTMAIKEAMRLYPPAHALGRHTPTGDRIGGHTIPPGSTVILSPWVTHRRPDLWLEPDQFNPDRFDPATAASRHPFAYFPFAGGVRGCIGEHFAMTEAIVAAATLLSAYTLHTPPGPFAVTTGITLHPNHPVPCNVAPRKRPTRLVDPP